MGGGAHDTYGQLLGRAADPYLVLDASAAVAYANPRAELLLGYDLGTLTGTPLCGLLGPGGSPHLAVLRRRPESAVEVARGEATDLPETAVVALRRRDGGLIPAEVSASEAIDAQGELAGWLLLIRERPDPLLVAERRQGDLAALNALGTALSVSHEPDRLLQAALQRTVSALGGAAAAISLLDVESQTMPVAAQFELPADILSQRAGQVLGEGDLGSVALTGRPVARDAVPVRLGPDRVERWAWAAAPLKAHERTIGVLEVFWPGPSLPRRDLHLLAAVGLQIGMAYQHAWLSREMEANLEAQRQMRLQLERLYRREQRRAEQFRVANELGRRMTSILDRDVLLWEVVELLSRSFDYFYVLIALLDDHGPAVRAAYGRDRGRDADLVGLRVEDPERGMAAWVARHGDALLVPDVSKDARYFRAPSLSRTRSALALPLRGREGVIGVLDIESDRLADFDGIDVSLLEAIAAQVSVAVENARLYAQTREVGKLEERNRLAREIHDTLAQGFTGIVLQLEAAEQAASVHVEGALEHVGRARVLARESLAEARRSVWDLRPSPLDRRGLLAAVQLEIDRFTTASSGRVSATFAHPPFLAVLSPTLETALLRIVQEALQNVRLHSRASEVEVALAVEDDVLDLRITDDGVGIEGAGHLGSHGSGFGLISMRERAQLAGGSFVVRSEAGRGTSIEVTVPLHPAAAAALP